MPVPPQPILCGQIDVRHVDQSHALLPPQADLPAPSQQAPLPSHICQHPTMDPAQVMQALATLTHNPVTLTDNVNQFIQNPPPVNIPALVLCPKSYVQHLATYNGKTPMDARRFLAAYKA